jgi:hypothetical protein
MQQVRRYPYAPFVPLLVCLVSPALAQAPPATDGLLQELREQMLQMQVQMREMQAQHDREISELRQEIETLRAAGSAAGGAAPAPGEEDELARLRRLAAAEAAPAEEAPAPAPEDTVFRAGGLSLQSLNPEISVVGDMISLVRNQDGTRERSDFTVRCLGLHLESYLDPYTRFKVAIPVNEDGANLGEAYMTRYGVLPQVNLTLGKFRQQFGVVNRWHKHGLDQVDFPLALREIFGPGGLNQTGLSLDWAMPELLGGSQELTLQITDSSNPRLFAGNDRLNTPAGLIHYRNFRDLTKDLYVELGLTGFVGWQDQWTVDDVTEHRSLSSRVFGADLSLLWEPTEQMRYRNVEWRSELYWLNRDLLAPDGSGKDTINSWGFYSYLQTKLNRDWDVGTRFDLYQADDKDHATAWMAPLVYPHDDAYRWQLSPYVTWHQSPFVRYRLEYDHIDGHGMDEREDVLMFQVIFSAGPHKHDRY